MRSFEQHPFAITAAKYQPCLEYFWEYQNGLGMFREHCCGGVGFVQFLQGLSCILIQVFCGFGMGNGHGTQGERGHGREKKFRHCVSHLIHGESPDKENNFGSEHSGSESLRYKLFRSERPSLEREGLHSKWADPAYLCCSAHGCAFLLDTSATNDANQDDHDGDNQKYVNKSPHGVGGNESEPPEEE
jgi:hypothetical protein